MNAVRHIFTHWMTSSFGVAIGALAWFTSNCPTSKYAAGATVILGLLAKDPNKN